MGFNFENIKKWFNELLSNSENVSSNRIAFLLIIFCVIGLVISYIIISIKGVVWGIPTIEVLDKMNVLILGILGSGIVTKQVAKYLEKKDENGN